MTKFNDQYRIESARMKNWNYNQQGSYYVTILTADRECFFGNIIKGKMELNEIGLIAQKEWLLSPELRPDMNLFLGDFVIMPNHMHGLITIGKNEFNDYNNQKIKGGINQMNKFGPQKKNLSSIMRGFKSSVTKQAQIMNPKFGWHERFHDHIIKSYEEYLRITEYIISNPMNWTGEITFFKG